jgi:ferredoxin
MTIDTDLCTGHGLSYATAKHLIEPDNRSHGIVVVDHVDPALADEARKAVASCPERAVAITDD